MFRALLFLLGTTLLCAADRPRLLVLTDIGGDPDDQQSLVRLMVYSNEFEIEGLVASAAGTPGELKQAVTIAAVGASGPAKAAVEKVGGTLILPAAKAVPEDAKPKKRKKKSKSDDD